MSGAGERTFTGWFMTEPGKKLEKRQFAAPPAGAGEVLIEVAGCGVCHTDISFLHMGVKTRAALPLILGHEVAGIVREAGDGVDREILGKPVLVPAVLPCGECDLCRAGHRPICRRQIMPGNDRHGGFATHMTIPARWVSPVSEAALKTHELWELSAVADAVSTPFMAVRRSALAEGELAIVVGAGGIGIHCVQIAAAAGAKVVALDIDPRKLEMAMAAGARAAIDVKGLQAKEVRKKASEAAAAAGAPAFCWKIFETSGTRAGQETAFNLMGFGSYMAVVGFTTDRLELRISNLMAFDATMRGNWGCDPVLYPEILEWIAAGRLQVRPFVEKHPLDEVNEVLDAAHHGKLLKRAVLVP